MNMQKVTGSKICIFLLSSVFHFYGTPLSLLLFHFYGTQPQLKIFPKKPVTNLNPFPPKNFQEIFTHVTS